MSGTIERIRAGLGLAAGAAAATAIPDAINLYRNATTAAGQFQNDIIFPNDLIQTDRDFYISLKFMRYEKRSINTSPFLRNEGGIRLPLPESLRDNSAVSYGQPSLGPAVGAALDALTSERPEVNESGFESVVGRLGGAVLSGTQGAGAEALQNAAPNVAAAASAYFGLAINPYQTVLFEKPQFKKHSFSWRLLPKTEKESDDVRNIIRTLQYHMHPGVSSNVGLFFSFPSRVIVSLYPASDFLYRFKPCVVESVNVNYAAGSSPSFFKRTNAPTAISISISLLEIEYWTNNDFTTQSFSDNFALGNFRTPENTAARISGNTSTERNNTGSGI
jgi:hypothetical protein